MQETFHYLLMSDHLMIQKALISSVKDTGLTSGQPKVLDYLLRHDGAIQKEIAIFCHIEPASLTAILNGMENKGYIKRKTAALSMSISRKAEKSMLTVSIWNLPGSNPRL